MADKKVERSGRQRPLTPAQKLGSSLSDPGTVSMADPVHDKGKSALVDKFRQREERWRREQTIRDREAAYGTPGAAEHGGEDSAEAGEQPATEGPEEGGAT